MIPGFSRNCLRTSCTTTPAVRPTARMASAENMKAITAARIAGVSRGRLLVRHVLPNIVAPLIEQTGSALQTWATKGGGDVC